ncbi:hypothetical protein ACSLNK_29535, partial [Escherichia coli]
SSTFRVTGFAYCMMFSSVVHIFRDTGRCRASIKAGRTGGDAGLTQLYRMRDAQLWRHIEFHPECNAIYAALD